MREVRTNIEFNYVFQTNSQGLRYREIPLQKPEGAVRVFVVGDSMTEGTGVGEDETFSALLEWAFSRKDRPVNFIDGGLAGTAPFEYGRIFLAVGLKYQPDGLLIAISGNDVSGTSPTARAESIDPGATPRRSGLKKVAHGLWPHTYTLLYQISVAYQDRRRIKTDDFIWTLSTEARRRGISQQQIDEYKARVPESLVAATNRGTFDANNLLAYGLLNPAYLTDTFDIDTPTANAKWTAMAAILTETIKRARHRGIEVAMVYLPDSAQYDPAFHNLATPNPGRDAGVRVRNHWLDTQSELQRRLERLSLELAVPFLDLTPRFREVIKEGPVLTYPLDGHWTPAGHRVALTAIERWLREKGIFGLTDSTSSSPAPSRGAG